MADKRTVRLGFVGAGYMGQLAHLQNYWKLPGVELVALAEGRPKTAELVARTYGVREVYPHHGEMLRRAEIDAVVAITPFALNAELVEDALNAGKHILTEKPQVNTSAKGRELADLATKKGLIYQVGYMKRFDPGVRWAKAKIAAWKAGGAHGPLLSLRVWCGHGAWQWFREPPLDAGDKPAPYPSRLEARPAWMTDASWSEHQWWTNYYSHQTNLARYLIGEDYRLQTAKKLTRDGARSAFVQAAYEPSGAHLYFDFSSHADLRWDEGFEVRFRNARLSASMPSPLATRQTAEVRAYEHPGGDGPATETRPSFPALDGFAAQARQFVASVGGDEPPLSPASEAVKEVAFSEDLMRLWQEGAVAERPVRIGE